MEFFQLHHPPDVTVLCDRKDCEQVADYLEVDDHGQEYRVCRRGNQVLICHFVADLPLERRDSPARGDFQIMLARTHKRKRPGLIKSRDALGTALPRKLLMTTIAVRALCANGSDG